MHLTIGRIFSLVVALAYVVGLLIVAGGDPSALIACIYLFFPLAMIWYPEEIGSFTGYFGRGRLIDTETPPIFITFMGWLFLVGFPLWCYYLEVRSQLFNP